MPFVLLPFSLSGFKMRQRRLAYREHIKPYLKAFVMIDYITTIKKKSWLDHRAVDLLVIQVAINGPIGQD